MTELLQRDDYKVLQIVILFLQENLQKQYLVRQRFIDTRCGMFKEKSLQLSSKVYITLFT